MQLVKIIAALLVSFGLLGPNFVHSHNGATGIVKERMDAMKELGDKSKLVADLFKSKGDFDKTVLVEAVDAFVNHSLSMAELFPDTTESRSGSKTEALPLIWDDWDGFNAKIDEFILQSSLLRTTVGSTDDSAVLRKAFFASTKTCSGCHKKFRKPKR